MLQPPSLRRYATKYFTQVRHRVRQNLMHTKDTNEHANTNVQIDHHTTTDNSATRNASTNVTTPSTTEHSVRHSVRHSPRTQ
ncbi:hypothetical protein DY000_02045675 [Brassica cretica]|uniref:Uncharacterized protein n=1 Tax=Brassica cretica TaxID=69181 RepID=A0ABQ7EW73_BRACR|nr:hypothetical protein DY000_02045675 [Brassica cretica]